MKLILTRVGATPFNKDVDDLIRQVATGENGRIHYKGKLWSLVNNRVMGWMPLEMVNVGEIV